MTKPNKLLKVVSILFFIFGIIGVIAGIMIVVGLGALTALFTADAKATVMVIGFSGIITLAGAVVELLAGALGMKAKRLGICRVLAIIILVIGVIGVIVNVIIGAALTALGGNGSTMFTSVLSIILPILYFIGVRMQIKAQQ